MGSNTITIQGNGIVITITVTKHLEGEVRKLEMLLRYNYQNGIIDEEENVIFATEPKLFSIGRINLPKKIQSLKTTYVKIMDIDVKTIISEEEFEVQNTKKKIVRNKYEPKVTLKDKVYLDTYYSHQPGSVIVDENPTKIKAQELQIARWTLTKDQQLMKLNLGTNLEPQMVKMNA